jgi:uncharacterized protein YjiK
MRFGLLVLLVILLGGFIFWRDISGVVKGKSKEDNKVVAVIDKVRKGSAEPSLEVAISQQWDLPAELKEVSGIAYLDKDRFACVQDEKGIIFVYNHANKKIEKEIPFTSPGDFEDLALVGHTAWVVRADGTLFEVDMKNAAGTSKEYTTSLTVDQNIEGLAYDKANNRLLLAVKDKDPAGGDYKGIYAFDLSKKELAADPVWKIDLNNELFASNKAGNKGKEGKKGKAIHPAALAIHPSTGDMYVTDGPKSRLLIMDSGGNMKHLIELGDAFEQPEGITFGPQGELYISNEGNKQPGNILQVMLQ